MSKTWIQISEKALLSNYNQFKKLVGTKKIMTVLKSNAYGHGLTEVAQILSKSGVYCFGVDSAQEALILSSLNLKLSILVLGFIPLNELVDLIRADVSFTVYDLEHLKKVVSLDVDKPAKVHLKIDTGMHRQGIYNSEIVEVINYIKQNSDKLILEGVSTHFADVKNPPDFEFTKAQLDKFKEAKQLIKSLYNSEVLFHTAATAATLLYEETHMDMVRVGIGLYGYWPAEEVHSFLKNKDINLTPVLTWKSLVAQVKEIEVGESISYSRTWKAAKKTKIAIIPIGYYDGFDRGLSNKGEVLINGKRAKVLGRVCMNMIVVDVEKTPSIKQGDEVVIIGKSGEEMITADDIASKIDTINYEVLARLNSETERKVLEI